MRTPAFAASWTTALGSFAWVCSPSDSKTTTLDPKKPMSAVARSSIPPSGNSMDSSAMAFSDVKMPCGSAVPPSGVRRSTAAWSASLSSVGVWVMTPPSLNETMPTRTVVGWLSMNTCAAAFAASIRFGSRSSASMLLETSKARMAVPSTRGRSMSAWGLANAVSRSVRARSCRTIGTSRRPPGRAESDCASAPAAANPERPRWRSHNQASATMGTAMRPSRSSG